MAPESLKKPRKYSKASDVWSFGVLVYEITYNGEKPWPDWPPKKIATHIRKASMPSLPAKTVPELKELVAKMWQLNHADRPPMREIRNKVAKMLKNTPAPKPNKFAVNKLKGVERTTNDVIFEDEQTDNRNSIDSAVPGSAGMQKSTTEEDNKPIASTRQ